MLDPVLAPRLGRLGLHRVDALLALGGHPERSSLVTTVDLALEGTSGRFHLKRYRYGSWRTSKGLVGRGSLWGLAPEIREFEALRWLRDHGFPAVRPVAAASRTRRGRLRSHLLLTEHVEGARDLSARLDDPRDRLHRDARLRRRVLAVLSDLVGRMHETGFVHADLYPRNVLVGLDGGAIRIHLLDCRRGGRPTRRRRDVDDLAAMERDLAARLSLTERWRALERYATVRGRDATRLYRSVRIRVGRDGRAPR